VSIYRAQAGLRLDEASLAKITYIAKYNKRSLNGQVEFLIQECIKQFENEHEEIIIEKTD